MIPRWIRRWWSTRRKGAPEPEHLRRGRVGEEAARRTLAAAGLKFLAANFRHEAGEIDLVFRDGNGLVFVEVKTRSSEDWTRPAAAVDAEKRRRISRTALAYLGRIGNPKVVFRFDIVEVLLKDGEVAEVRHLVNAFPLDPRHRYV